MELNIHIPDNTAALFDCLQKGQFISSNSCNEAVRDMYDKDFDGIQVEGLEGFKEARDFMRVLMPSCTM